MPGMSSHPIDSGAGGTAIAVRMADRFLERVRLRLASTDDAAAIAAIYAPYVSNSIVSFETDPPDAAEMGRRIAGGGALYPWFVACDDADSAVGFAYASSFRPRHAYRFTVETSVYLAEAAKGQGIGETL